MFEINFNITDTVQLILVVITFLLAYFLHKKGKGILVSSLPLLLLGAVFFTSPVNITQDDSGRLFTNELGEIPERVGMSKKSFEEKQQGKFEKLKKESEEKRDEEIN